MCGGAEAGRGITGRACVSERKLRENKRGRVQGRNGNVGRKREQTKREKQKSVGGVPTDFVCQICFKRPAYSSAKYLMVRTIWEV